MYYKQMQLQQKLGNLKKIQKSKKMRQQFINQMLLGVHEEAVEIMKETAYKNPDYVEFGWKKGQTFNEEKFKEEIVDLMHFVLNLSIAADMDAEELHMRYLIKNKVNYERKTNGY